MKHILALSVCVALAACATPYQDMGFTGGVEAQRIDDRTVRISARGNGYTDAARIRDYTLLKAAESTLDAGYRYFGIVSSGDASRQETMVMPGHANTTVYGNSGYATASTVYTPSQAINVIKPGQDLYVRMYKDGEASGSQGVFDAQQVRKHLGAKYIKQN